MNKEHEDEALSTPDKEAAPTDANGVKRRDLAQAGLSPAVEQGAAAGAVIGERRGADLFRPEDQ